MTGMALVMSGGGARGAYEVGVLSYLYQDFIEKFGKAPRFDFMSGTSVGAVNCTALAATIDDPASGMQLLSDIWVNQQLSDVLAFNLRQATRLYRVWLGGGVSAGIFDSKPLARVISHQIPWRQLVRNLKADRFKALTVSATNVRTGRSTVYIDRARGVPLPNSGRRVVIRPSHILPQHVLASAAMPLVFPPVRIGNDYFCDGGIRLNTPTSPAIHLGASRIFVIGVTTPQHQSEIPLGRTPGASYLLGKALDALMLDHIEHDVERMNLINDILSDATEAIGPDFLDRLNAVSTEHGRPRRQFIDTFVLHPSVDIGMIAGEHLRTHRPKLSRMLGRAALRLLEVGEGRDADLASYLLFDGDFTRILVDLGRKDAERHADQMAEFLLANESPP
ncbi:MAG: patatin-like phospholipase family protein [Myxococcales bacterium]|nr:patatin-like phospholipase family protein [Myxococcales bacterium]